jgi:hypothetical protein
MFGVDIDAYMYASNKSTRIVTKYVMFGRKITIKELLVNIAMALSNNMQ